MGFASELMTYTTTNTRTLRLWLTTLFLGCFQSIHDGNFENYQLINDKARSHIFRVEMPPAGSKDSRHHSDRCSLDHSSFSHPTHDFIYTRTTLFKTLAQYSPTPKTTSPPQQQSSPPSPHQYSSSPPPISPSSQPYSLKSATPSHPAHPVSHSPRS